MSMAKEGLVHVRKEIEEEEDPVGQFLERS